MEKKKRTTNLRTRQHLTPMRSSETLGLSAYGETVKKKTKTHTGPVSGGNTVILTDSSEGGRPCETSAAIWNSNIQTSLSSTFAPLTVTVFILGVNFAI